MSIVNFNVNDGLYWISQQPMSPQTNLVIQQIGRDAGGRMVPDGAVVISDSSTQICYVRGVLAPQAGVPGGCALF
jgi:hypothetical protein